MERLTDDEAQTVINSLAEGIMVDASGISFRPGLTPETAFALYRVAPNPEALLDLLRLSERQAALCDARESRVDLPTPGG